MIISTEIMVINVISNGLTHNTINFKKRKVMDDLTRNFIINAIFKDFCVKVFRNLNSMVT